MRHTRIMPAVLAALLGGADAAPAQERLVVPEEGYAVSDNPELLPEPVRAKRDRLLAAARSGDIGQLKAIFATEPAPPTVSFGQPDDPIDYLRQQSGDGDGVEILAILAELLSAPYAAMDGGDGDHLFVWPYLAAIDDLGTLTPQQQVDGYRILGYAGFSDLQAVGTWFYWRVHIGNDGELQAFVAGD